MASENQHEKGDKTQDAENGEDDNGDFDGTRSNAQK